MKIKQRDTKANTRQDGNNTKALIIECAGRLIAEHGYAATTSKMICEKAGTNLAAVNYHFGSRDGLYIAVLEEVHKHLLNIDDLNELLIDNCPPLTKLEQFIDTLLTAIYSNNNWHVRVWAREVINPSPFIYQILSKEAAPKFIAASKIFSDATGLPLGDLKLYTCMLGVMAPFIIIFLSNTKIVNKVVPKIEISQPKMIRELKKFVFAGLTAYTKT